MMDATTYSPTFQSAASYSPLLTAQPKKLNQKPTESQNSTLIAIKQLDRESIFSQAVEKNLLLADGSFNKNAQVCIPPLPQDAVNRLLKELSRSHLIKILRFILKLSIEIHPLHSEVPFKIVGSWAFWILGESYVREVFSQHGISLNLSPETRKNLFQEPADLDIRVSMYGATVAQLQQAGREICAYLKAKYADMPGAKLKLPNLERRKPIPSESNCFFSLPIVIFGKKIDIVLVSILEHPSLYAADNICINITKEIIDACRLLNQPGFQLPTIVPKALTDTVEVLTQEMSLNQSLSHGGKHREADSNVGVLHALLFKVAGINWAPLVARINAQGAFKHILSLSRQCTCLKSDFEAPLVHSFLSMLNHVRGSAFAIGLLHDSVQNHLPNQPAAYTVTCFNICALLQAYKIENWQDWARLLFNEMGCEKRQAEPLAAKSNFFALYQLLKTQTIPFEALSAYLLMLSLLLEHHKECLEQKIAISAALRHTAGRQVVFITFHEENLSLMLPSDILGALTTLQTFFSSTQLELSAATQSHLFQLSFPFFQGMEFSIRRNADRPSYLMEEPFAMQALQMAKQLLTFKPLKSIGMCLACLFSPSTVNSSAELARMLAGYLELEPHTDQRACVALSFFNHFKNACPADTIFRNSELIDRFIKNLSLTSTSNIDALKQLCKLLSNSSHPNIALGVLDTWSCLAKWIVPSESLKVAYEILDNYLAIQPAQILLALKALHFFALNPKISYAQLEPKFYKLYASACKAAPASSLSCEDRFKHIYHLPLLLKKAALILLTKAKGTEKHSGQGSYYLEIMKKLLESSIDDALSLFKLIGTKKIFPNGHQEYESLRLHLCGRLFERGLVSDAILQWEVGIQQGNQQAYVDLLLSWPITELADDSLQNLLLKACLDHLDSSKAERLMLLISKFKSGRPTWNLHSKGQWLLIQLDRHYRQQPSNRRYECMLAYLACLESLIDHWQDTKHARLINIVGAHCFSLLHPHSALPDSAWEGMQALASDLLESTHEAQLIGFAMMCHLAAEHKIASRVNLKEYFPKLIIQESRPDVRLIVFRKFLSYLQAYNSSLPANALILTGEAVLLNPNASPHEILMALSQAFADSSDENCVEVALMAWSGLKRSDDDGLLIFVKKLLNSAPEKALHFFGELENKGLLAKIQPAKLFSLQLEICRQRYSMGLKEEACTYIFKIYRQEFANQCLELLLEWESAHPPANYLKHLLKATSFPISLKDKNLLADAIVKLLLETSDGQPCEFLLPQHIDWLLCNLKSIPPSQQEALIQKLAIQNFPVEKHLKGDGFKLLTPLLALYGQNGAIDALFERLVLATDSHPCQPNQHRADLFFEINRVTRQNWALAYASLKKGLQNLPGDIPEDYHELLLNNLNLLKANQRHEECMEFLCKLKLPFPASFLKEKAHALMEVIPHFRERPLMAAKMLIQEASLLKDYASEGLYPRVEEICLLCLAKKEDSQMQALQLIQLYDLSTATLWLAIFPHFISTTAAGRKAAELIAGHPHPFTGENAATAQCWMTFIPFIEPDHAAVFHQLFLRKDEILDALRFNSSRESLLKTYFCFAIGSFSALLQGKSTTDNEDLLTLTRLLAEFYEIHASAHSALTLNFALAEQAFAHHPLTSLIFGFGCERLIKICHADMEDCERLFKVAKNAIAQFEKISHPSNSLKAKLKHICYITIRNYPHKFKVLPFHSFLERHGGLGSFDLSYSIVKSIFYEIEQYQKLSNLSEHELKEIHKHSLKPLLLTSLHYFNQVSPKRARKLLTHSSIQFFLSPAELSFCWANLLNHLLVQAKNSPLEVQKTILRDSFAQAFYVTAKGENEMLFFVNLAELLLTYCHASKDYAFYEQHVLPSCHQLKHESELEAFHEKTQARFLKFIDDPLLGSLDFKILLKESCLKFFKTSSFPQASDLLPQSQIIEFLHALISRFIEYNEKRDQTDEFQAYIQANIFYLISLLIHSSAPPSDSYAAIFELALSNPSLDSEIATMQSLMAAVLYEMAQTAHKFDSQSAETMFDIMLLLRHRVSEMPIKLPKIKQQAHLAGLIVLLCHRKISSQTARAFSMLEACQETMLGSHPGRLKATYKAMIEAAVRDPWMMVARVKINTNQFASVTMYTPIIEEVYAEKVEASSIIPLILGVGRALLLMADKIVYSQQLDQLSDRKAIFHNSHLSAEMEAVLKELIWDYLEAAKECILEVQAPSEQPLPGKKLFFEFSDICKKMHQYLQKIKSFPFMADQLTKLEDFIYTESTL